MKALNLKKNKELSISDVPAPSIQPDHSLVRIEYVGLCSSDIARTYSNGAYHYPIVIGHEAMGTVIESSSHECSQGDKVVIFPLKPCFKCDNCKSENYQRCVSYSYYGSREDGAMQEILNVNNWNLVKIDGDINPADAALTEPTAVMVHVNNILKASLQEAEYINDSGAIIGGGFLSLILSRILKICNSNDHIIFDRNEFKIDFAQKKGIQVRKHTDIDDRKYSNSFRWVVEASGDPSSINQAIKLCMPGGMIILMSNIYDDVSIPKDSFSTILRKELTIKGSWNSSFSKTKKNDWQETLNFFKKGLTPSEFVTHNIDLEGVNEILENFYLHKQRKQQFNAVKALVRVSDDNSA